MTIELQLKGFNSANARAFCRVLKWYGLNYKKSTDNDTRIIKLDKVFRYSKEFIIFCMKISEKYTDRKRQRVNAYDMFWVDVAIANVTEPYLAVLTLHVKKHEYK